MAAYHISPLPYDDVSSRTYYETSRAAARASLRGSFRSTCYLTLFITYLPLCLFRSYLRASLRAFFTCIYTSYFTCYLTLFLTCLPLCHFTSLFGSSPAPRLLPHWPPPSLAPRITQAPGPRYRATRGLDVFEGWDGREARRRDEGYL